jgi:protein gp37
LPNTPLTLGGAKAARPSLADVWRRHDARCAGEIVNVGTDSGDGAVSDRSAIEWTDATWNPVTGCTKISPGCAHCYIEHTPPFRIHGRHFVNGHIPLQLHPDRLEQPLHWRHPRRIFVNSLSDLFHDDVPDQFIHDVYHTMESAQQHQFHVLTKRPRRMRAYLEWRYGDGRMPSRHIWHGVTVENRRWRSRIDELRAAPTALRYLSLEPLLEDVGELDLRGIQWVIVGGESGLGARPCDMAWVRTIVRQCRAAGVAVFVKQLGVRPFHERAQGLPIILHARDRKGADPAEWPDDMRVREFPSVGCARVCRW